jgi:MacB-like periplasmic core domain
MLDALNQDLRLAYRSLWRTKTFTGIAALTLALGIAGTTLMFALIQRVRLRPLPVRDQDRLVIAWKELRSSGSARYPFGNTEIEAVSEASQLLEKAAGVTRNGVGRTAMIDDGVSAYANVGEVTGGFFDVLGVQPVLGRALSPADDKEGAENVIALSDRFWQRRLPLCKALLRSMRRDDDSALEDDRGDRPSRLLAPKHCHCVDARCPSNGQIGRKRRGSNDQHRGYQSADREPHGRCRIVRRGEQFIGQWIGHQADFARNQIVGQDELLSHFLRDVG